MTVNTSEKVFHDLELTPTDKIFLMELNQKILEFIESEEEMLELEPMNSYQRRLVHKLGILYSLASRSVGEKNERFVCLLRTEETHIPAIPVSFTKEFNIDYGQEIFYAKSMETIFLRIDGSFGVYLEGNEQPVLDERVIESGMFRIQNNRIICPQDDNW